MSTFESMPEFTYHPRKKGYMAASNAPKHLCEVYGSYSSAKQHALIYCLELCNKYHGFNFGIVSYNSWCFIVEFNCFDPVTNDLMLAHITRDYNHLYKV